MTYPPAEYSPTAPAPVCPRHPDRVSYVRCQRCGRPVCGDCQREASVGVQCVDCVKAQMASMRGATTVFGGTFRPGRPLVTLTIIVICVLVWVAELTIPTAFEMVALIPAYGAVEPWRFVTSAFAHSPSIMNFFHIGFNMYALWILGQYLEPMLGRARFAAIYLLSALGGGVAFVLMSFPLTSGNIYDSNWYTAVVGASGAVFGLFGALLVLNRRLRRSSAQMYSVLAINFVIGFLIPGIAWQAHLGGFLVGLATAWIVAHTGRAKPGDPHPAARKNQHWAWLAVVLVIEIALLAAKYALT